jgi:hypothetical protein
VSSEGSVSHSVTTLGYSEESRRFMGSVAGTAVPALFVYDGSLDETGTAILLETTGPAMTPGNITDRYRDVIQVHSPDARDTIMQLLDKTGQWVEFMRTRHRRAG